jgi:hypothetical protein
VELDKAQDTLAVKGVTRPLTYSVKELNLDLNIFPDFDGKVVRFTAAKPGERGASKISLQLGSITSEQIRRTTPKPVAGDDVDIEAVEGIDEEVKSNLRKYGVRSARDLEELENRNVDMEKITGDRPRPDEPTKKKTSYKDLASAIKRARRSRSAPRVSSVSLAQELDDTVIVIEGRNLAAVADEKNFPVAMLGERSVPVVSASDDALKLKVDVDDLRKLPDKIHIALDPYAVIKMNLNPPAPRHEETTENP